MKIAGHELRGLLSYFNSGVEDLHMPLMCLIDSQGYRLTAMTLLPINSNTIRYGSADAGITMYSSNSKLNELIKKTASRINLEGHLVRGHQM